jgi:hypothetical protein
MKRLTLPLLDLRLNSLNPNDNILDSPTVEKEPSSLKEKSRNFKRKLSFIIRPIRDFPREKDQSYSPELQQVQEQEETTLSMAPSRESEWVSLSSFVHSHLFNGFCSQQPTRFFVPFLIVKPSLVAVIPSTSVDRKLWSLLPGSREVFEDFIVVTPVTIKTKSFTKN